MFVFTNLRFSLPKRFKNIVLTLGAFDGVHAGHQEILKQVVRDARRLGGTPAVLTFQEHPQKVLQPERKTSMLTSFVHKLSLLQRYGIELCVAPHFSRSFSKMEPAEFVREVLVKRLRVRKVVLGHDSRFGRKRKGNIRTMASLARRFGFDFDWADAVKIRGRVVSSTLLRKLISQGRLSDVKSLLGRPYSLCGEVVRGKGLGRKIGYRTANIDPHSEALPPNGVYLTRVKKVESIRRRAGRLMCMQFRVNPVGSFGLLNLGFRPTVSRGSHTVCSEVHIPGVSANLYGKTLEVELLRHLRPEKRFRTLTELKNGISRDVQVAHRLVKSGALQAG